MKEMSYIKGIESLLPPMLDTDSGLYKEGKIKQYEYFYFVDKEGKKEVYSKAVLEMSVVDFSKTFMWVLWIKFPIRKFIEMSENLEGDNASIKVNVVDPIFFYEDETDAIELMAGFNLKEKAHYPKIEILESKTSIYQDFKNGMSKEKYLKLQDRFKDEKN